MFFSFSVPQDHSTSIRVGMEARSLIISTNASISSQGVPISGLTDPIRLVLCMGRIVDAFASVYQCVNNFSKSTTTGLSTNPLMSGTLTRVGCRCLATVQGIHEAGGRNMSIK